jgi:tetratricopeptide (TPR) repeat protein
LRLAAFLAGILFAGCARQSHTKEYSDPGLLAGVGSVNHPISTSSPGAQRFFEQGLALTYGFNFPEAIKSFRRASELDPKSPMPYWGIALANGPNYNSSNPTSARLDASRDAIQTALTLSAAASKVEQAYVNALAQSLASGSSESRRDYANAMREVYRAYPNDPDAAVLFASSLMNLNPWRLWSVEGEAGPDTPEIVTVLEGVLRRWPDHLGANHFYVHTMEGSPHPDRALASARRLETLAPAAGHLVHMPSHIYLRTGDYSEAVKCNQRAVAVDDAHLSSQPAERTSGAGYFRHNFHFLAVSAGMDGEYQVAADAAAKLQAHAHSGFHIAMPMMLLLRFGQWDEVIAMPEPNSDMDGVRYFWRYARAFAYASKGSVDEAAQERREMKHEFANLREGRAFGMFLNDWSAIHEIASDALDARIAFARGDAAGSIRLWESAALLEDKLNFDDVPDWYYPVRESWGAALLRSGQAANAEEVFREDLHRNPRNPRSLLGLCKALEAQKKDSEANSARREFEAAWKGGRPPRIEDY